MLVYDEISLRLTNVKLEKCYQLSHKIFSSWILFFVRHIRYLFYIQFLVKSRQNSRTFGVNAQRTLLKTKRGIHV